MFTSTIQPRFLETDALGHINNTVLPEWFEQGREPIFKLFTPDLDITKWALIIARIQIDFFAELRYGEEAIIETNLSRIGRSSMDVLQRASQGGRVCAQGKAIMVHYDFKQGTSLDIPDPIRNQLKEHLLDEHSS